MQKVSYMGNGETTEFYFNFPYFETGNIVVTMNNGPAPTYNIIGSSGGENADFPFIGGRVVFAVAPRATDSITISRQLPMTRIADYQPFAHIEPTTLNQDLNYLMEVIKDKQDELNDLSAQYADIADKESTATLLARISAIHDEIVAIDAKITALGDISTLRTDVTDLQTITNNLINNPKYTTPNLSQGTALNDGDTLPCDAFVYWIGSGMGNWKNIGITVNGTSTFGIASLYAVQMGITLPKGSVITKTEGTTSVKYYPLN